MLRHPNLTACSVSAPKRNAKDGKTSGGQGSVNKSVPVTPGFFFVRRIVEFDDQCRTEFVACAEYESRDVAALDFIFQPRAANPLA